MTDLGWKSNYVVDVWLGKNRNCTAKSATFPRHSPQILSAISLRNKQTNSAWNTNSQQAENPYPGSINNNANQWGELLHSKCRNALNDATLPCRVSLTIFRELGIFRSTADRRPGAGAVATSLGARARPGAWPVGDVRTHRPSVQSREVSKTQRTLSPT